MQPFTKTLTHFFTLFTGSEHRNTIINIWESSDFGSTTRLVNTVSGPMDINSLLANIEAIYTEIHADSASS